MAKIKVSHRNNRKYGIGLIGRYSSSVCIYNSPWCCSCYIVFHSDVVDFFYWDRNVRSTRLRSWETFKFKTDNIGFSGETGHPVFETGARWDYTELQCKTVFMARQLSWGLLHWFVMMSMSDTIATSLIHSKIDCCNSLLLNLLPTQANRLQLLLSSCCTTTPELHLITPILKSLHCLKINERIKYTRFSLSDINLSKLVSLLTSALFFHSLHIVIFGLLFSPLVALLSPLVLKLQTDLSIFLLLFCGTVSYLIFVALLITSLLLLY